MIKSSIWQKVISTVLVGLLLCGLSGCMLLPQEKEEREVSFYKVEEIPQYSFISPERMDMEKVVDIPCVYRQKNDVQLSFNLANLRVNIVNVKSGDKVKKGTLLASLDMNDLEEEIKPLEQDIKLMKQSIEFLRLKASYDKQSAELEYKYNNITKVQMHQNIRTIEDNLKTEVEAKEDEIYIQNLMLEKKKKLLSEGKLYAPIDGVVSFVQEDLLGSLSEINSIVINMVDLSECAFEIYVSEDTGFLKTGEIYTVNCEGSSYEGTVLPQEGNKTGFIYLRLNKPPKNLSVGKNGFIRHLVAKKKNALVLPVDLIHKGEGYYFVYVVNKDNVKCIQKVEIGLKNNDYVEIVSGLKDDDKILN